MANTPESLPRGISYALREDRPDRPHKFGAYDSSTRRYRWKTFARYDKGVAWAKDQRLSLDREESTSLRPLLSVVGPLYLEKLRGQNASPKHVQDVSKILDQLKKAGVADLSADCFPSQVQRWLNGMRSHRLKGNTDKGPAAPRTKRRCLTIARAIAHWAMKLPGRPLRFDPLLTVVAPRIDAFDKPVFTVPELRALVSEQCRRALQYRQQAFAAAMEQAQGDKREVARILGCHLSSVYNRLAREPEPACDDPWWLYSCLAIYTGARPAEVQSMRWEWLRLQEDCIILPANCPGNKMRIERIIALQPELRAILMELVKVGRSGPMLDERITTLDVSPRAIQFKRYAARCGIEVGARGPHSLRHNHGALSVALQLHPVQVMLAMGHDNVKVSLSYSRTAPRFRLDVKGWSGRFYLRDAPPAQVVPMTEKEAGHAG